MDTETLDTSSETEQKRNIFIRVFGNILVLRDYTCCSNNSRRYYRWYGWHRD